MGRRAATASCIFLVVFHVIDVRRLCDNFCA